MPKDGMLFRFDYTRLVVGTKFYEKIYANLVPFIVTEDYQIEFTTRGEAELRWKARIANENSEASSCKPIDFMVNSKFQHYGPKIYTEDEIIEFKGALFTSR